MLLRRGPLFFPVIARSPLFVLSLRGAAFSPVIARSPLFSCHCEEPPFFPVIARSLGDAAISHHRTSTRDLMGTQALPILRTNPYGLLPICKVLLFPLSLRRVPFFPTIARSPLFFTSLRGAPFFSCHCEEPRRRGNLMPPHIRLLRCARNDRGRAVKRFRCARNDRGRAVKRFRCARNDRGRAVKRFRCARNDRGRAVERFSLHSQ